MTYVVCLRVDLNPVPYVKESDKRPCTGCGAECWISKGVLEAVPKGTIVCPDCVGIMAAEEAARVHDAARDKPGEAM